MEEMTAVAIVPLCRMRRQCRTLNDAYEAAEDKPGARSSLQAALTQLRALHELLPFSLRGRSWVLTLEYHDDWTGEARQAAGRLGAPWNGACG